MMRDYYELIKPGIVYGNVMTTLAAFIFAAQHPLSFFVLACTLGGVSLSIAGACVVNNILDRDIDLYMERTKGRPIPNGRISVISALGYGLGLLIAGLLLLYVYTSIYAFAVTVIGVLVYVGLYTPAKRTTQHSTIIGSVAGAVPPVAGYAAAAHTLDTSAALLFLILVCWQMAHFFAIAIYRKDEYARAKLPIMSVQAGVMRTKILMIVYIGLYAYAVILLGFERMLGLPYLIPMGLICTVWTFFGITGFRLKNEKRWARLMFFYSIFALISFCFAIALS